jgi:hypothetical protein
LIFLTCRDEGGSKLFDVLQEKSSRDEYGTVLGRLVCFYLRSLEAEVDLDSDSDSDSDSEDSEKSQWSERYPLTTVQRVKLENLSKDLESNSEDTDALDKAFHGAIKELFCWQESRKLLSDMACPAQRFLVVLCLRKGGEGFINVRNITPLVAKLLYCIRATVFMELIKRNGRDGVEVRMDKDLDGLGAYVRDLVQSPFGFLRETMHLAGAIAGDTTSLPQICWLGDKEYTSLAIRGKRVELSELRNLSRALLKEAEIQLHSRVKMGISAAKCGRWEEFDAEDDLANTDDKYSFISSCKDISKRRKGLLKAFMANGYTKGFFSKGRNGKTILWNKSNCMEWLKRTKALLEMLVVLCHLLGGQPARGAEMATLRWRNSVHEQRGFYWANGSGMLLGIYSKTRSMTGRNSLIPR